MKTAGEILSVLFDEQFMEKAHGYSKLFDSWAELTAKNGIAAAAAHSRIKDLDRGILLVETDHPGWKQILQTKQNKLLNDYRRRFPDLEISGISLILGKSGQQPKTDGLQTAGFDGNSYLEKAETVKEPVVPAAAVKAEETAERGLDAIDDEDFKKTLKNLEQNISAREKSLRKRF